MSIEARQISFSYPRAPLVLAALSCTIPSGVLSVIVGPNGGGKSTLIRLLAGLRTPRSGTITLGGRDLASLGASRRARAIAFIEQRPSLAFDFSARRVIEFGARASHASPSRVGDAIERFELGGLARQPFGRLSVGQQQRVSFARAWVQIAGNPAGYLLADEPCSAMDPRHAQQVMLAMAGLGESGIGVCVVLHDLTSAARWADEAIVLSGSGEIAAAGAAKDTLVEETLSGVFRVPIRRHELEGGDPILVPALAEQPRA